MKYLKLYSDKSWMESVALKGKPGTIVLTDEQYEQLGKTLEFKNGQLVAKVQEVNNYASTIY